MSKQQIHKRICPEAIARVLRQWNDGSITTKMAMGALDVSRPQLYRLWTTWLGRGKKRSVKFNVSGGDHSEAWPKECVEHLTKMLESSGDHGPDYALYADELDRIYGFRRDRSNVRKYCEAHFDKLLRKLFPIERGMRTFQHRLAIVFASQEVSCAAEGNEVAFDHYRHWNATHHHREFGCTPHEARRRLSEEGKNAMRPPRNFEHVKLFLSLRERRRVELGNRIEFPRWWWTIAKTLRKTVVLAIRPHEREFYVLEDDLDPTSENVPRILGKFSF